ncbi:Organellar oligopeptidase [Phytophthora fragariae]|uniref:oligopeptidase A n=1 Tax=Phytophthora fragariae TaxID=53985 RepID=A0A6A3Y8W6_9STRA|nr:Organellar oligopeptidase [Phytophthora fragariae]KAE8939397.1 Organellar oligopeptidase [Phytophthora fragariae]KAE9012859.1 Organellar oligopeptidase [Phytophthora fragariae]KAE9115438.1 Organellar oligopeptidase [Phytophthora fragariae]KAE9116155.1 Organellar oligopeptidase [Phytophthora fragariae]
MLLRCVRPLRAASSSATSRRTSLFWRSFTSASVNSLEVCVRERQLPPFERLQLAEIEPAVTAAAAVFTRDLRELEKTLQDAGNGVQFADVVDPLETQGDALGRMWGVVGHLMSVRNSEELRAVHDKLQQLVIETVTEASQSKTLYDAYLAVREGDEWSKLELAQQRIIELSLRSATLSGVGLQGEDKDKFNKLKLRAAELSTKFSSNLLDATKAYSITVTDKKELEGLPPSLLQMFAQSARDDGHSEATPENGPWRVTLDPPSYVQFMKYSANRSLRETLYRAYATRASGESFDNEGIIVELLEIRQQIAKLLGFGSYAEVSISKKMAPSVEEVEKMHRDLREKCVEIAHEEVKTVAEYAKEHGQTEPLAPWDLGYWSEKLKAEKYLFTDEEIKPYFPLERVLDGLFSLTSRLFGVTIEAADGQAEVWNSDVRFFNVRSTEGDKEVIAQFFLDPYSRPKEKNGGAWMNTCVDRSRLLGPKEKGGKRIPVAYIICNQSPPVGETPSLMTFREVETIFHEFGHGLQHMLTQMEYGDVAGINGIEWDAVEIPSQMMENFCYDKDTIAAISGHYKTGEPLPDELFEKLKAARNYMVATGMLRQLGFGALDMYLHSHYSPSQEPLFAAQQRLLSEYAVLRPLEEDRFLCSFAHIFAGGYAAGYYSYKWAEILSCDAYGAFEEAAKESPEAAARVGRRFRDTILARGGGQHPEQVFEAFRGRKPSVLPLLTQYGMADK